MALFRCVVCSELVFAPWPATNESVCRLCGAPGVVTSGDDDGDRLVLRERREDTVVLALEGEWCLVRRDMFESALARLMAAGVTHFVLDLQPTTFIDCSMLHAFLALAARADEASGGVALAGPHGIALTALDLTGVAERLSIHADPAAALLALGATVLANDGPRREDDRVDDAARLG